MSSILGNLTVTGLDTDLNLDDSKAEQSQNYVMTASTFTRAGIATITYSGLERLDLFEAAGGVLPNPPGNTLAIQGTSARP